MYKLRNRLDVLKACMDAASRGRDISRSRDSYSDLHVPNEVAHFSKTGMQGKVYEEGYLVVLDAVEDWFFSGAGQRYTRQTRSVAVAYGGGKVLAAHAELQDSRKGPYFARPPVPKIESFKFGVFVPGPWTEELPMFKEQAEKKS